MQRGRVYRLTHCAIWVGIASALAGRCEGQEASKSIPPQPQAFIPEYRSALAASRTSLDRVRAAGILSEEYFLEGGKTERFKHRIEYGRNGAMKSMRVHKLLWDGASAGEGETVYVRAEKGSFVVKKKSDGDPYFARNISDRETPLLKMAFEKYEPGYLEAASTLHGLRIEKMLGSPDFKLKDCQVIDESGRSLVKISFDYTAANERRTHISGWWTVAPAEGWAVQAYEFRRGYTGNETTRGSVQYARASDGSRVPKRVLVSYASGPIHWDYTFDFDRFDRVAAPERDFSLAAFGLTSSESSHAQRSGSGAAPLLFGMAATALTLSTLMNLAIRRHRRRGIAPAVS